MPGVSQALQQHQQLENTPAATFWGKTLSMQAMQHQIYPVHPPQTSPSTSQQPGPPVQLPALRPGLLSPLLPAHSPTQLLPGKLKCPRQRKHEGDD